MPWIVYITGLPGSGKSARARALLKLLTARKIKASYLRLDEIRKEIVPEPEYTEEEREYVYAELCRRGLALYRRGKNVVLDATAYRKKWRNMAREQVKDFLEVYIKCDLETCVQRESGRKAGLVMAQIYNKALERKKTGKDIPGLGEVVGIDVAYEENDKAELVIDSSRISVENAARQILEGMARRGWLG